MANPMLTTGLNYAVQIGPNISIRAKRTKPTANASATTAIAISVFKTSMKSIIGATAAITKNIEPINSQTMKILGFTKQESSILIPKGFRDPLLYIIPGNPKGV